MIVISGCNTEEPAEDTNADAREQGASSRGEGPGSSSDADAGKACCDQQALRSIDASESATDCGELLLIDPGQSWIDANHCVLDGLEAERDFAVIFQRPSVNRVIYDKYIGVFDGKFEVRAYHYDSEYASISGQVCASITETPDCEVGTQGLCLTCNPAGEPFVLCP